MAVPKHRQKKKEKYKSPGSPHKGETKSSMIKALAIGQGRKDVKQGKEKVKKLIKEYGEKTVKSFFRLAGAELELLGVKTKYKEKKGGKIKKKK